MRAWIETPVIRVAVSSDLESEPIALKNEYMVMVRTKRIKRLMKNALAVGLRPVIQ